jgi:hypothetical protein
MEGLNISSGASNHVITIQETFIDFNQIKRSTVVGSTGWKYIRGAELCSGVTDSSASCKFKDSVTWKT